MEKIKKKINFLDWPKFTSRDVKSTKNILLSGKVNYWSGSKGREFEILFKKKFHLKYTVAISNASIGLNLAINCLNLKKDDEVLVTPRSFIASASCVLTTKAKPIFCDINPNTQGISIEEIKKKTTKKTKAIICVHLAGIPCEINEIVKFANKKKIIVIEDCSQAHGSKINNRHVGSFGDFSVWSFCNDKIISTGGEGGMLSTKKQKFYKKLFSMKDHGKNFHRKTPASKLYFKYIHDDMGSNYRMTEIQAQLGINQLRQIDSTAKRRFKIFKTLNNKIKKTKLLEDIKVPKNYFVSAYRVYLYAKNKKIRNFFLNKINRNGIECNQGTCPEIYKEKLFKEFKKIICKNAKEIGEKSICLPSHQLIDDKKLNYMVKTINKVISDAENKFINEC